MGSGSRLGHKGSAYCCIKYGFIAFNILIWLLGFGVLTVGVWMHVNRAPYVTLLPDTSFLAATVLTICAGAIMFVLGVCGCCGAMLESQCMLVVYFVLVLVIFGLEVVATSLCITNQQEIQRWLYEEVRHSIQQDYQPELAHTQNGGVVAVVDSIQSNFECCGIDNHTDWYSISAWPNQRNVPVSCCVQPVDGCGEAGSKAALYSRGCLVEVKYWFMKNMYTLGMIGLAVAVLQILTMSASVALFCCLRKKKSIL